MAGTGKWKRFFSRLGGAALALIAAGLVFLAAVLLQSPGDSQKAASVPAAEQAPVTRMQAAQMDDVSALARMFESRLPALPGWTPHGRGENALHDGAPARLVTLTYNGVILSAVRPASAAPLLLHGELDVALRSDLTVLNLPAVLAQKGRAHCLYFSDESAAYAVYAPDAEEEAFLAVIPRLAWVLPSP